MDIILIYIILGLGVGGAAIYLFLKLTSHKKELKVPVNGTTKERQYPIIGATLEDIKKTVHDFSNSLPKGVYRTILVKEDNSIDFKQLAHLLGGIPERKYFMSKETYDIFEEHEKHIPGEMDIVQKAVDLYVKEHNEYPMLPFDPEHRVNYYQLIQDKYLKSAPEIQFYITDLDGLITHKKPAKKTSS
ncbi:DUF3939 domain-containing protein [Neobacillus sp. 114]|uniref:DUF3939 domain-containing protein n=1 Tax=Neobacillus sp. 114 TaxID=3048535 RepID=UPI001C2335C0|nr:DUF3939 domain-containing protein [Neobacillus sp. 114]MBU8915700.1 DUF3939 domain-containing protein [Bacillus sp. FJAT-29953]